MSELFEDLGRDVQLAEGAALLRGFAMVVDGLLLAGIDRVTADAPLRHMITPGGHRMAVAMTNCGATGWITDRTGYHYNAIDPQSGAPWPPMPAVFIDLATRAAARGGFDRFVPDACLINRYEPGGKLSLHQDRNERDFDAPIVSVSLGLPAVFLFGGRKRTDRPRRVKLTHGDVVVWGGPARMAFHGVAALADGDHPLIGRRRLNLTFRLAL
jgi:DNA oxidative demethylase